MRTRGLASLVTCLLLAYGCGGTTANNDARDAKDSGPDLPVDRPADGGGTGGGGGSDAKDALLDVPGSDLTVDGVDGGDGGGPPPCTVASECPGQDSECRHRVCAAGVCGMANEATGKVLGAQTIGDCKVRACGADGLPAVGTDDLDKPDDLNPCTNDICTNGTPSHTNAAAATACGSGKMCNASGQCVGCTVAADCPGTDNECRTRTCIQSTCGVTFKAAGTKVADTTPGDCKGRQCDGQGVIQVADLTTDVPTDDNACTVDQCNGGTPNHGPSPRNSSCGGAKICDGASHCVECLTAATCPGTDSDCQTRVCTAGVCGVSNAASGKVVTSQIAGDCKKDQCNGQGVVVSVNDDTDIHNDNNACTNDICTAGAPSNPPKAAQVACGTNLKCDGAGQCVGCLTAADCEPDGPCVTHACSPSGMCITSYTAAGTAAGTQVAKDCKKKQCDGAGNIAEVEDGGDVPVDGTACTTDVCTGGMPSNPPVPIGTTCAEGGGIKCNGAGACVACIAPADCGPDTACKKFTCSVAGVCGQNNPPAGTDAGGQIAGDCKKKVCDGAGMESPTPEDDSTDAPDDGNFCTADTCMVPMHPPAHEGDTCGSGSMPQFCVAGQCTGGCNVPADCGTDSTCRTYTCMNNMCGHTDAAMTVMLPAGEQTAGDCKTVFCNGTGGIRMADEDTDRPVDDGNVCTNEICTAGVASHPAALAGKACTTGGVHCDGAGACGPVVTLVAINEVTSNNPDRFELYNTSATVAVDISGWVMKDDTDTGATHIFVFPADTVLQPHQFKDFLSATFLVGLGSADKVRLFAADGTTLITSVAWTNHPTWTGQPTATWGRCPDGTGAFRLNATATAEAANDCSMTAPAAPLPPTSSP